MAPASPPPVQKHFLAEPLAVSIVVVLLLVSGLLTLQGAMRLRANRESVVHTYEVLAQIDRVSTTLVDAETAQRGFLITGDESHLEPYSQSLGAIDATVADLTRLTADNPTQQELLDGLRPQIDQRLAELKEPIDVYREEGGIEAAKAAVATDIGARLMDRVRDRLAQMRQVEIDLMEDRKQRLSQTYNSSLLTTAVTTLAGLALVGGIVYLLQHNRRRAENAATAIFAERERLRVTLASIGDGVISTDRDGNVTFQNAISEGLTGWTNEEARGQPLESIFKIINEDTRETVENPGLPALREGVIMGLANHTLLISKQGSECPIDDSAAPIRTRDGAIDGAVLVFRDVTDRRAEERQQQEVAQFLGAVLDALPASVLVLDDQLNVINHNRTFEDTFGAIDRGSAAASVFEIVGGQLDVPELRALLEGLTVEGDRVQQDEVDHDFASIGRCVLRMAVRRFDSGRPGRGSVLLVLSDVTGQRRLEAMHRRLDRQMRQFLEQVKDYAIFSMDVDCRATSWNQGVQQVLGFEEKEFLGEDIRQLIFPPEAIAEGSHEAEFRTARESGDASDDRWMLRKGGERIWASGITTAIRDEDDQLIGYSKVMRDLTQRKLAQDELAELAAKLSEMDRRKNEFLATLAHELRNPLAPIKNAVQLMGLSQLDTETEELRETMARQVEQLVRLIDDLLDVSRISRGKIALRKEVVDLRSIVDAAVEASRPFIAESGQELDVVHSDADVFIDADPSRMTQVVSNLLNNSAKYSNAGSRITLETGSEDGRAFVRVTDEGIGLAADQLEGIFQMFSQVSDSLERGAAGLGIGLTLVKTLMELHGGSVTAQSEGLGLGSVFCVTLPETSKPVAADAQQPADGQAKKTARSFQVLVVEDMHALRVILARLLERLGHHVVTVENGAQALERLDSYSPQVVLSDISMPGMTGYELVRRIRARLDTSDIFCVAMTGYGQDTDREKAFEAGFNEHLIKPVDIADLETLFQRLDEGGA
ncbi:Autoinducer 2 sensor kinase/phosphatase LuxQ [Pirellulimonas nuda]|uniref:histidine kinase n=1 Tax=Pirellulimonas nuda TaxID=2528009 RepID=A0A518D702_9BACT|nr:CHASE3 domain-containing protein [Pirellulimonas nuda]QDU87263.1 Autoinducer 2 sensor kinase/phosphatase LuxQ [Pirellulimonas nuda]